MDMFKYDSTLTEQIESNPRIAQRITEIIDRTPVISNSPTNTRGISSKEPIQQQELRTGTTSKQKTLSSRFSYRTV
jgi:hypothetical protein